MHMPLIFVMLSVGSRSILAGEWCLRAYKPLRALRPSLLPVECGDAHISPNFLSPFQAVAPSSTSISFVVVRLPLSVVRPLPASASLIEYGSSRSALTLEHRQYTRKCYIMQATHLRLCTLPFWCAVKLPSLSKNFAHSLQ
jgi:hypothetical protein